MEASRLSLVVQRFSELLIISVRGETYVRSRHPPTIFENLYTIIFVFLRKEKKKRTIQEHRLYLFNSYNVDNY